MLFFLRLLMGVVESVTAAEVSQIVNASGVDLLLSDLLNNKSGGRLEWRLSRYTCMFIRSLSSSVFG